MTSVKEPTPLTRTPRGVTPSSSSNNAEPTNNTLSRNGKSYAQIVVGENREKNITPTESKKLQEGNHEENNKIVLTSKDIVNNHHHQQNNKSHHHHHHNNNHHGGGKPNNFCGRTKFKDKPKTEESHNNNNNNSVEYVIAPPPKVNPWLKFKSIHSTLINTTNDRDNCQQATNNNKIPTTSSVKSSTATTASGSGGTINQSRNGISSNPNNTNTYAKGKLPSGNLKHQHHTTTRVSVSKDGK